MPTIYPVIVDDKQHPDRLTFRTQQGDYHLENVAPPSPLTGKKKSPAKNSLAIIQRLLSQSGVGLTLSRDNRIIGTHLTISENDALQSKLEALQSIVETVLIFNKGWQWFVAGLVDMGLGLSEDFAQVLDKSDSTISNWLGVYRAYEVSERCFDLSFTHYAELSGMRDKRARLNLLAQAQEKNWSVQELRRARNLDAGNPTPQLDYEFTVFNGVSSPIKLWNSGAIDKAQYEELIRKYGKGELSVEIKVLGRR